MELQTGLQVRCPAKHSGWGGWVAGINGARCCPEGIVGLRASGLGQPKCPFLRPSLRPPLVHAPPAPSAAGGWKVSLPPLKKKLPSSLAAEEKACPSSMGRDSFLDTSAAAYPGAPFGSHRMESSSGDITMIEEVRLENPKVSAQQE